MQLTLTIQVTEGESQMYSNSDNIKFTSYNDVNEVANELFE